MGKLYKYTLEEDYCYYSDNLLGIEYEGKFGKISNGIIVIYKGYSWDGCSVKLFKLGKLFIGTPDGWFDGLRFKKDWTKNASLVHDFLYQFNKDISGITRLEADMTFKEILVLIEFPMAALYYKAVRLLGDKFWEK